MCQENKNICIFCLGILKAFWFLIKKCVWVKICNDTLKNVPFSNRQIYNILRTFDCMQMKDLNLNILYIFKRLHDWLFSSVKSKYTCYVCINRLLGTDKKISITFQEQCNLKVIQNSTCSVKVLMIIMT